MTNTAYQPQISVVCPCYNEADCIDELHARLTAICQQCATHSYEILLVNDGSTDETWQKISHIAAQDPKIIAINLSKNHGHQLALSAGLSICKGQKILILDADLQDPPELLPQMLALMDEGAEVVYGQRNKRAGETFFKKSSAKLFYRLLAKLSDVAIPLDSGDFRLMSRQALNVFLAMPEHNRFIRGMVSWIGFKQVPLYYDRAPRFAGISKYPLSKMLHFASDAITSFSIRPLRIASFLGLVFGIMGLLTLIYVFYSWIMNETIQGWTSLMAIVLVLGSSQLLVAGVIGEYVGRMYIESKGRPLFVIKEILNQPPS